MSLENEINKLANKDLSPREMSEAVFNLTGLFKVLVEIHKEVNLYESGNLSESIIEGTRGRALAGCPSFTTYRICDKKKLECC